ncbi:MAG: sialate O-acetylesterase [Gemmatimonadota bacterium]|nr:sialate O-acetylesterase [Gemmatimonadota bacterium]
MTISRAIVLALACSLMGCTRRSPAPPTDAPPSLQLFLLAGQSNMAGRGAVEAQDRVPVDGIVMLDRNLAWVPAIDPVHFDKSVAGVGPGRGFALALHATEPSVTIGLVPTAVGGSPISSWEPGAFDAATKTHPYDDALARARAARRDGRFRAILWHQGESDATPEHSILYATRLRALIARLRSDLGEPELPFIIGQLGQFPRSSWTAARERVDSAQRAIAATTPNVAFVTSDGLQHRGDNLHFNSASARELGRRYAAAYLDLVRKRR